MIGTGIFTSLGFQVVQWGIPDPFSILVIWILGGVIALCGAVSYCEVATTIPESGGEYTFLSKIYHPIVGLSSGWVSLIVGFSASIASLGLAAGEYLGPLYSTLIPHISADYMSKFFGILLILIVTAIQLFGVKASGVFQNFVTYLKIGFILFIIISPFIFSSKLGYSEISFLPSDISFKTIFSLPFAGSLVFVMFAYSGWNASSYIAGNINNPQKSLPHSLISGTAVVSVLYLLLTLVFLYVCTFEELAGQVDIGNLVVSKMFGPSFSIFFGVLFSIALISGINAMFIAGPRVAQKIGEDYSFFSKLSKQTPKGAPTNAILLQASVSILFILISSFKEIIEYMGITLSLFSLLTVLGLFVLRNKKKQNKNTVKAWGYPVTPFVFILCTSWMIFYFVKNDPKVIIWSLLTIIPALPIYFLTKK